MRRRLLRTLAAITLTGLVPTALAACSDDANDPAPAPGGAPSSGGAPAPDGAPSSQVMAPNGTNMAATADTQPV